MKKYILLTGVTGFLGSHVLKDLIRKDNYNIICLKRRCSDMVRINGFNLAGVKFYNIDEINLEEVFCNNKISMLLHMATAYGRNNESISSVLKSNLIFPLELAELCIKHGVKKFLNVDSYFNKGAGTYNHLLNYSLSKKSLLSWLEVLSNDLSVVNILLEHIYGEKDSPSKFVESAIRKIAINQEDSIDLTHCHQRRDFIYIDDVVDAINIIISFSFDSDFKYKTFEVGTGEASEIKFFIDTISKLSKSRTKLKYGSIKYRSDEIMESKANLKELKKLGFKPKFDIEAGIEKITDIYRNE